jgi:hypothetical protein
MKKMSQRKMIIKGVGNFLARRYNKELKGEEVITLGSLQDLRITLNVDIEDIFGGDGLFAIDTIVTGKNIEVSATDAQFDLDAVRLMMGDSGKTGVEDQYLNVLNEKVSVKDESNGIETVGALHPEYADTLFGTTETDPDFVVRARNSNLLLKRVPYQVDKEPLVGEFMVDRVGKRVLVDSVAYDEDGLIISYKRSDSSVEAYALLSDEVPFNVHVIHNGVFLQKDNTKAGVETELYQCRAMGEFSIDAARSTASTTVINLKVLDPDRVDKRLGTIKRFTVE